MPLKHRGAASIGFVAGRLSPGDEFPHVTVEGTGGAVALSERWRERPLVIAFERHFG